MKRPPSGLKFALKIAARGYRVHPVRWPSKAPLLKDWPTRASSDPLDIEEMWAANPRAVVGVACGPELAVDLDEKNQKNGIQAWIAWCADHGIDLEEFAQRTLSGGAHIFYLLPEGMRLGDSSGSLPPGIDIRGFGGQIVAYQELPPVSKLPIAPEPLLQALKRPLPRERRAGRGTVRDPNLGLHPYAQRAIGYELDRLDECARGGDMWDNTVYSVACNLIEFANSPWSGYSLDQAHADWLNHAPVDNAGFPESRRDAKWESALQKIRDGDRPDPEENRPTPEEVFDMVDETNGAERNDVVPSPKFPLAVARAVLADYIADGVSTLMHWRGCWLEWVGSRWVEIEDRQIRSQLYKRLEHAVFLDSETGSELHPWGPTQSRISNVIDALAGAAHAAEDIEAPSWLDDTGGAPAREIVAAANTLLHVTSRRQIDLTPRFFNRVSVPFDYEPDAAQPHRWLAFLDELWPDDPESVALLQEWFGYVLSGRTDMHKILLMVGPPRSGKGTIGRILTALVGTGNVAAPTLDALGTNFGMSPLLGKAVAIVPDARIAGNGEKIVERLLSISGEDTLTVDRKYKDPFTGKLTTRFVIISNELPHFGDSSGAIVNRFVMLATTKSFLDQEDFTLETALRKELPGILCWALDGLDRLLTRGHFTVPQATRDAFATMMDMASPMGAFLRDCTETQVGARATVHELYAKWRLWCIDNGIDRPGTIQRFGRDLLSQRPSVKRSHWDVGGVDTRGYIGIRVCDGSDLL